MIPQANPKPQLWLCLRGRRDLQAGAQEALCTTEAVSTGKNQDIPHAMLQGTMPKRAFAKVSQNRTVSRLGWARSILYGGQVGALGFQNR
jgi:hypothetical protein